MKTLQYLIWRKYWKFKCKKEAYIDYLRIAYGINGVGKTLNVEDK